MAADFGIHAPSQLPAARQPGVAGMLGLPDSVLQPLLEGARARGLADAFEMMGQGAAFLDGSGVVLHVTSYARACFGGALAVAGGHLVGAGTASNQAIGAIVEAALAGDTGAETTVAAPTGGLRLRAFALQDALNSPYQLMKAVILISFAPAEA